MLFLAFQLLRHYMRMSTCTTKLFAQPSCLWKNMCNCNIIRTADTKLTTQIKYVTFAKQNWKPATFALRAMTLRGVRLANHLSAAVLTFSTKPRAFLPLHATVGIWGIWLSWSETCSLQVPMRSPGKTWPLKNSRNTEDSPVFRLRQYPSLHESSILYENVVTL